LPILKSAIGDLAGQLKRKIDIMNAHWEDYKRLVPTVLRFDGLRIDQHTFT
jgi:glutamine synthetase